MKKAENYFKPEDAERIISLRHELHRHPELGFALRNTVKLVEKELSSLGLSYTERFAPGSVVAEFGPKNAKLTLALRADMDALPIEEQNSDDFCSEIPGCMHACGHDAHTAMLLGAARALRRAEAAGDLSCRVKLLFQPNEEGSGSGAEVMVRNGVMDGVDFVCGQHVDPYYKTGTVAFCDGPMEAGCCSYDITFHGKSTHATEPADGADPLAMAVRAYEGIYLMKCRMIGPFEDHIVSVSSLHSGSAHNIIPDEATMKVSVRSYHADLEERIRKKIYEICEDSAKEFGGSVEISCDAGLPPVVIPKEINDIGRRAAAQTFGEKQVLMGEKSMGSEDFSYYLAECPGIFSLLGVRNEEKGYTEQLHNCRFRVDDAALLKGATYFVQLVLNYADQGE